MFNRCVYCNKLFIFDANLANHESFNECEEHRRVVLKHMKEEMKPKRYILKPTRKPPAIPANKSTMVVAKRRDDDKKSDSIFTDALIVAGIASAIDSGSSSSDDSGSFSGGGGDFGGGGASSDW